MSKYVLIDAEVELTWYISGKKYPESFRLIRYYDEEDDCDFILLTNATHISALDVANLYKKDGRSNYSSNGKSGTLK